MTIGATDDKGLADWVSAKRKRRTVMVADVVESVRLMQIDEETFIDLWRRFMVDVRIRILPPESGRLVKSLGDGMLVEFETVSGALRASVEMHNAVAVLNQGRARDVAMHLRVGLHVADIVVDELDIYGSGVNLAARLATLAGPRETVLSVEARDQCIQGMDADLEDMGECFLKHLREPVRAFRVRSGESRWDLRPNGEAFQATIAVIPCPGADDPTSVDSTLATVFATRVTAGLSRSRHWRVVSNLSTNSFMHRGVPAQDASKILGARYIVRVAPIPGNSTSTFDVDLCDAASEFVFWRDRFDVGAGELVDADSPAVAETIRRISSSIMAAEVLKSTDRPLPSLAGHSILLSSIVWMHRMTRGDSKRAREALEYLAERYPRNAEPGAWLGKWHLVQLAQAWSDEPASDTLRAKAMMQRVLELDPDHAQALAIDGHISAYGSGDLNHADKRLGEAIRSNPNEPLAWLFLSNLLANRGDGVRALEAAELASMLSPIDPMRFYFEIFWAYAALVAGNLALAERLATHSCELNRMHLPSYPVLIVAHMLSGNDEQARARARDYVAIYPGASVKLYCEAHRGKPEIVARFAGALKEAGFPP